MVKFVLCSATIYLEKDLPFRQPGDHLNLHSSGQGFSFWDSVGLKIFIYF